MVEDGSGDGMGQHAMPRGGTGGQLPGDVRADRAVTLEHRGVRGHAGGRAAGAAPQQREHGDRHADPAAHTAREPGVVGELPLQQEIGEDVRPQLRVRPGSPGTRREPVRAILLRTELHWTALHRTELHRTELRRAAPVRLSLRPRAGGLLHGLQ